MMCCCNNLLLATFIYTQMKALESKYKHGPGNMYKASGYNNPDFTTYTTDIALMYYHLWLNVMEQA